LRWLVPPHRDFDRLIFWRTWRGLVASWPRLVPSPPATQRQWADHYRRSGGGHLSVAATATPMTCSVNDSAGSMRGPVFPVVLRASSVRIKNHSLPHGPWMGGHEARRAVMPVGRFVDSSRTLRSPAKKRRGWPAFAGHDVWGPAVTGWGGHRSAPHRRHGHSGLIASASQVLRRADPHPVRCANRPLPQGRRGEVTQAVTAGAAWGRRLLSDPALPARVSVW